MVGAFGAADASNNERLFVLPVLRDQYPHRFPDNLLGLVSEEPLGCAVPAGDSAVEVLADNCVVGRLNDGCEALRSNLSTLSLRHIHQHIHLSNKNTPTVKDGRCELKERNATTLTCFSSHF